MELIKNILLILLIFCQLFVFAQDKKVLKIADYIAKGKDTKAKKLLDELDNKKELQSDIYYWYVRTVCYRNIALSNSNATNELEEARKSFEKLVELDKKDSSKSLSEYIPQIKKDLYEGKNQINTSGNNAQSGSISQAKDDGNTITLTQIGEGRTKEEAKNNALRNAIEKAFGTFISSNTTILNDELIKDEVVSISSGNIQNFEILSETQMPDGNYSSVVKATVSIEKLTTFFENKGIAVEFKGGLFAANIKLLEINEKNENDVMKNLFQILNEIIQNGFDYTINVYEPRKSDYPFNDWLVKFSVTAKSNNNLNGIQNLILSTIDNICLTPDEIEDYQNKNIDTFFIHINGKEYRFRNLKSVFYLTWLLRDLVPLASINFSVSDGINVFNSLSMLTNVTRTYSGGRSNSDKVNEEIPYKSSCVLGGDWIVVNYPVMYSIVNSYSGTKKNENQRVKDFLRGINTYTYERIKSKFNDRRPLYGDPWYDLNYFDSGEIRFTFCFDKIYSLDQLSKVTEYIITPKN